MGSGGLTETKQNKKGECDSSWFISMNLRRAFISALDTELKPSKKLLPRVLNLHLLRSGQLQRRCSTVFNFSPAIVRLGFVTDLSDKSNN